MHTEVKEQGTDQTCLATCSYRVLKQQQQQQKLGCCSICRIVPCNTQRHVTRNDVCVNERSENTTVFSSCVADEISEDELRAKKSELRLYCDLLMQQVHSVKQAVNQQDKTQPDLQVGTALYCTALSRWVLHCPGGYSTEVY